MKKLLLGAAIALLPLSGFSATILGIQAGAGSWKHDPSGYISTDLDGVGVTADLKSDLQLKEDTEGYVYFAIEHPVPLIPNFKYMNTKLTSAGSGTLTANFNFNGVAYSAASAITTKLQLDQTDYILYYEVLDNVVSFDVGLNAKQIDGEVTVNSDTTAFTGTIPMLYVGAELLLPAGFAIVGEISTISAGDNKITDTAIKLTYTSDFNFGLEVGTRSQDYVIDVDTVKADMKFSGLFAGVFFKF